MSIALKSCSFCGRVADTTTEYCSLLCERAKQSIEPLLDTIEKHQHTDDPRIFFYDTGFGDICDRYTVLLLRRAHQKNLAEQRETEYYIGRVLQSIMSKVNRSCYHSTTKTNIIKLLRDLHATNAQLWHVRSVALDGRRPLPERESAAMAYLTGGELRDKLKTQLDAMVEGRIRIARV